MQISDEQVRNAMRILKESRKRSKEKQGPEDRLNADDPEVKASLDRATEEIDKLPDVRESRVEEIREAIESSEYEVTDCQVARKMLGRSLSDRIK